MKNKKIKAVKSIFQKANKYRCWTVFATKGDLEKIENNDIKKNK